MTLEHLVVRLGDFWKFRPRSQKMMVCAVLILGFVLYVPMPYQMLDNDAVLWLFNGLMLAGFWFAFYGIYCMFREQFKLRKHAG